MYRLFGQWVGFQANFSEDQCVWLARWIVFWLWSILDICHLKLFWFSIWHSFGNEHEISNRTLLKNLKWISTYLQIIANLRVRNTIFNIERTKKGFQFAKNVMSGARELGIEPKRRLLRERILILLPKDKSFQIIFKLKVKIRMNWISIAAWNHEKSDKPQKIAIIHPNIHIEYQIIAVDGNVFSPRLATL